MTTVDLPLDTGAGLEALQASDAVVAWCLRNALRTERRGDIEQAALWGYVAAGTAAEFGHSYACSAPLESLLLRVGARIPSTVPPPSPRPAPSRARWLHVFTATGRIGGHTAIARRWIARNPSRRQHSIALTVQSGTDVDPSLADVVRASGGAIHPLAERGSMLQRAAALRELAWQHADVVVLHTHMWDVLPALAFARPGGPPVLLMNHADHAFWVGCAVSDRVVDIRDSGLALTATLRSARGSALLPVPLEDRGPAAPSRAAAAARLNDPAQLDRSLVLLTIGDPRKYQAGGRLDFADTLEQVLESLPDCALIAVGPGPDLPLWRGLRERTGGRVVAVGQDPDLAPWHAAADLFLESFPVGSYTALLEVALAGRAFVRKPHLMPPSVLPIDRGALAAFDPPPDTRAYATMAKALADDPGRRAQLAHEARRCVLATHCGEAWDARLAALEEGLPDGHDAALAGTPPPMPEPLARYWAAYHRAARATPNPLVYAQGAAQRHGLQARTDIAVLDAIRRLDETEA